MHQKQTLFFDLKTCLRSKAPHSSYRRATARQRRPWAMQQSAKKKVETKSDLRVHSNVFQHVVKHRQTTQWAMLEGPRNFRTTSEAWLQGFSTLTSGPSSRCNVVNLIFAECCFSVIPVQSFEILLLWPSFAIDGVVSFLLHKIYVQLPGKFITSVQKRHEESNVSFFFLFQLFCVFPTSDTILSSFHRLIITIKTSSTSLNAKSFFRFVVIWHFLETIHCARHNSSNSQSLSRLMVQRLL